MPILSNFKCQLSFNWHLNLNNVCRFSTAYGVNIYIIYYMANDTTENGLHQCVF